MTPLADLPVVGGPMLLNEVASEEEDDNDDDMMRVYECTLVWTECSSIRDVSQYPLDLS